MFSVQEQTINTAPFHQSLHLLSIGQVIAVPNETYHCCFICILDDVIKSRCGTAVICQQREQQWARNRALRRADGAGDAVSHSY